MTLTHTSDTDTRIVPMPTEQATYYRQGGKDANNQAPELGTSSSTGLPCRHCLQMIKAGEQYLTLSHCPFPEPQPYAESGPIFLHAQSCNAYSEHSSLPTMIREGAPRIVRAYGFDNRIIYGTGKIVEAVEIQDYAAKLLSYKQVAYVHVRSSENNCYTFRIDRASNKVVTT